MVQTASIDRHLQEMLRNKSAWERKPLLREAYANLYAAIRTRLPESGGPVVELGSGLGTIKNYIPEAITTDLFDNPWIQRRENAYQLSFPDCSLGCLILFDVFHHLEFPGAALAEFHRVLRPGGRLILMEPGFGFAGRVIYSLLHHEPVGFSRPISWAPEPGQPVQQNRYYAAQGNAWRIFLCERKFQLSGQWRVHTIEQICALSYVLTGGFSKPSLVPPAVFSRLQRWERRLQKWPKLFATRLLVALEKI